jgi:uncharacterized protein (DUF2235 family)
MKPRNLVVCSDGTWCSPEQEMGALPAPTNVVKLSKLCLRDEQQLVYYHPGVGAEGSLLDPSARRRYRSGSQPQYHRRLPLAVRPLPQG